MTISLDVVVRVLEELYPPGSAQSWDRVGLVTGDLDQPVRRIHLAVDPTLAVIDEARDHGADLLVTHHPLLLRGVHSVATTTGKGAAVTALIVADIALYAAHTNADVAEPGVCDALATACGLTGGLAPITFEEGRPMGRVGALAEEIPLGEFASRLAEALPQAPVGVRVSGPADAPVRRVAVLGGAGDSLLGAARACGADVYVTADLRHHPAIDAREETRGGPPYLVDAGHWATESLWLEEAGRRIVAGLAAAGQDVTGLTVAVSRLRTDPWDFVVGATGPAALASPRRTSPVTETAAATPPAPLFERPAPKELTDEG